MGNLIVNCIFAAILYGSYILTPWASLVIGLLSSSLIVYSFVFDREWVDRISEDISDKLSLLCGATISILGIVMSVVKLSAV